MFKRTWIIWIMTLAVVLNGCGGSHLAEELTPIPTLPPGSEPELVSALRGGTDQPTTETGEEMDQEEQVALGEQLFAGACSACHGAQDSAGPAFTGMGGQAAARIEGMTAEAYLYESIVDPGAFLVEGFNNMMPKGFGNQYNDIELRSLVVYILAASGGNAVTQATPGSTGQVMSETPAGEPDANRAAGEELFMTNCSACHGEQDGAGPARTGMSTRAVTRIEGLSAEEYMRQAIVDPGAHIVETFSNIMPKAYGEQLSEQELTDLIAYLLTQ